MDVTLPDGTVLRDVPEGTTRQQIWERLQGTSLAGALGDWAPEPDAPDLSVEEAAIQAELTDPLMETLGETGRFVRDTVRNLPRSVASQLGSLYDVATDIPGTIEGTAALAGGAGAKLRRALGLPQTETGAADEATLDAAVDYYGDRYGTREDFLETVREDPASVALDVAGVVSPAIPSAASASPPLAIARGATRAAEAGGKGLGRTLQRSSVKPSGTIPAPVRERIVETTLREGLRPSGRGVAKAQGIIDDLSGKVDDLIKRAGDGDGIYPEALYVYMDDLRDRKRGGVETERDLAAINRQEAKVRAQVDEILAESGSDRLTAAQLQRLKKSLQAEGGYNVKGPKKQSRAAANRTMGRAAREAVEELAPDVAAENQRLGAVIEAKGPLEAARSRIENQRVLGIPDALNLASGAGLSWWLGPQVGVPLALGAEFLTNPRTAPLVAQGSYRAGQGAGAANRALNSGVASRTLPTTTAYMDMLSEILKEEER